MVKHNVMVASRWCWVADGGAVLLGNVIRGFHGGGAWLRSCKLMVVSRWVWVVGLRLCARGKCMHQVANRIVNVVSFGRGAQN